MVNNNLFADDDWVSKVLFCRLWPCTLCLALVFWAIPVLVYYDYTIVFGCSISNPQIVRPKGFDEWRIDAKAISFADNGLVSDFDVPPKGEEFTVSEWCPTLVECEHKFLPLYKSLQRNERNETECALRYLADYLPDRPLYTRFPFDWEYTDAITINLFFIVFGLTFVVILGAFIEYRIRLRREHNYLPY